MSEINKIAETLAENMTTENIGSLAKEYALKYDACISVWDPQLNVIVSDCVDPDCRVHTMPDASSFLILAKENGGTYTELSDKEWGFVTKVITDNNGDEYLVAVNAVIALPDTVSRLLNIVYIASAATVFLISVLLSYVFSKYLLRPLTGMNKTAKIFAGGDYAVSFDENSYEELSELAKTLNYATNELSTLDTTRNELMANVIKTLQAS